MKRQFPFYVKSIEGYYFIGKKIKESSLNMDQQSEEEDIVSLGGNRVIDGRCNIQTKVDRFTYMTTIEDFSLRGEKVGEKIVTSPFVVGKKDKSEWCLWIYPRGSCDEAEDCVSVYLMLNKYKRSEVKAKYKIYILNDKEEEQNLNEPDDVTIFSKGEGWGLAEFVKRCFLLDKDNGLLINDSLRIICELSVICDSENLSLSETPTSIKIPSPRLSLDFGSMLNSPQFTDCIVRVRNIDIRVHKAILANRSPVFYNIFINSVSKSQINVVEISNFRIEVVKVMLKYIYTDEVLDIEDKADEVLGIAEEYKLIRLKALAEYFLYTEMSIQNVCEYFLIAQEYSAEGLKECCQEFIINNAEDLIKTDNWKNLVADNPLLLGNLFIKALNLPSTENSFVTEQ